MSVLNILFYEQENLATTSSFPKSLQQLSLRNPTFTHLFIPPIPLTIQAEMRRILELKPHMGTGSQVLKP